MISGALNMAELGGSSERLSIRIISLDLGVHDDIKTMFCCGNPS